MPSGRDEWIAVAKAIYGRFGEVQITDRAAALTYYSILSLFPALLVVVSLLALLGEYPDTYQSIVETLRDAAPGAAVDTIDSALTALWFAVSLLFSAYVAHFGSYDKTYGTLGALISLLIWLWLGNLAFLLGALFNAEIKRVGDEDS
jgi:membrane protein